MRRTVYSVCAMLLVVVGLGSDSPKEYDDRTERVGIEGRWLLAEVSVAGCKLNISNQCMLTNGIRTYAVEDRNGYAVEGRYQFDPSCKPAHLDYIPSSGPFRGQVIKCIYQIDGDTLRIAFKVEPNEMGRPRGFDDDGVYVQTCKRVK